MHRKTFLQQLSLSTGGLIIAPAISTAQTQQPAPLQPDKVKEFVVAGHSDLNKVKSMLQETPALLFAAWDWGGGDFETALEGAGHVGNKEISNYLINFGARTNLFVLTMLGKTDLVKAYLESYPQYIHAKGPHGLSLLHHAQKGGDDSRELLTYLQSKGLTETKFKI